MTNVTVLGGEKGGTGKTTTAINLVIMSAIMGNDTLLIDADKQRSAAKFFERRNEKQIVPEVTCVSILGKHLNSEIERLSSRFDRVFIDVGGRDSVELRSSLIADPVKNWLSPLQPSELDMDTLETLDELASLSKNYNPKLNARIVLNSCPTHAQIKSKDEAREIIDEAFPDLSVCNATLGHRVAYQYSISHCKSVVEFEFDEYKKMPSYRKKSFLHKASKEIIELYNEIFDIPFKPLIKSEEKEEELV